MIILDWQTIPRSCMAKQPVLNSCKGVVDSSGNKSTSQFRYLMVRSRCTVWISGSAATSKQLEGNVFAGLVEGKGAREIHQWGARDKDQEMRKKQWKFVPFKKMEEEKRSGHMHINATSNEPWEEGRGRRESAIQPSSSGLQEGTPTIWINQE